jgi:nucleoside phosphorylase
VTIISKPVFLDFLNREAGRAANCDRPEDDDIAIIRILVVSLAHGFSANISQVAEYCNSRPKLFSQVIKLMQRGVIDATSSNATLSEFIEDRRARYSHVPERYPFYFSDQGGLVDLQLGTRNPFSMTGDLSRLILAYDQSKFDFDLVRLSPSDRAVFESGLNVIQSKVFKREDLAITRDLLVSNIAGGEMSARQIEAATRAISALYMKNYADRRSLATCTGIPQFSYRDVVENFPAFDFPLLKRALQALGALRQVSLWSIDDIIEHYGSLPHRHFSYHLQIFLDALAISARNKVNDSSDMSSIRLHIDRVFIQYLDIDYVKKFGNPEEFYRFGIERLIQCAARISQLDPIFNSTWSSQVSHQNNDVIAVTTATDSEDDALIQKLKESGFTSSRPVRVGNGFATEYTRGTSQHVYHLRTSAGSLGVNSAGLILPAALKELGATHLISVGICFGLLPEKNGEPYQKCGDVLVSTEIQDYETARIGTEKTINRGEKLPAGTGLLQAARLVRPNFAEADFKIYFGQIISGQKLVDSKEFVENLRTEFPGAIGGEMEGNAVSASGQFNGKEWVMIKGICDWGMGKTDNWQDVAALNACDVAMKMIVTFFDAQSR